MNMKLEVLIILVSDVDRAKAFYEKLGFRLDIDYAANEDFRVLQFILLLQRRRLSSAKGSRRPSVARRTA